MRSACSCSAAVEAKGRAEGRAEGLAEGQRALLLSQMEFKFGPLSAALVAAVQALPPERLQEVGQRVLTAQNLEELAL